MQPACYNVAMAHLLSAFIERPERIRFETQSPQETIILLLRAHPITNLGWIIISLLLFVAPFIFFNNLGFLGITPGPSISRISLIVTTVWELITFGYVFEQFLNYYFSVYIVTNLRVVDIDFINLLGKKVSDAQLSEIEDVTYTQNGVFRSIFNYGDVSIQTAGTKPEILFRAVPRPADVAQVVDELQPVGKTNGA